MGIERKNNGDNISRLYLFFSIQIIPDMNINAIIEVSKSTTIII